MRSGFGSAVRYGVGNFVRSGVESPGMQDTIVGRSIDNAHKFPSIQESISMKKSIHSHTVADHSKKSIDCRTVADHGENTCLDIH